MTEEQFKEWQRNKWKLDKRAYRAKKKLVNPSITSLDIKGDNK